MAHDERPRTTAILAFLAAGVPGSMSRATAVTTLANARKAVAAHRNRQEAISQWVASEIRARGVRECAAVFAVMEAGIEADEMARSYRQRYPDRAGVLDDALGILDNVDHRQAAE